MTDPTPFRVCFVCSGNICRSPYAEALLRQHAENEGLGESIESSSLGTLEIEGSPAHEMSVKIAAECGMSLISFRSRGTSPERAAAVDLLVGLAPDHVRILRSRFPEVDPSRIWLITAPGTLELPEGEGGIPDPIGTGEAEYRMALIEIDQAFPSLWSAILGQMRGDGG